MKKLILSLGFIASIYLLKAQNPTFQWVKTTGTINEKTAGNAITKDANGNTYTTGVFSGTVDFDPGTGIYNLSCPSAPGSGIFILKLDPNGNFIWAKGIGNTESFNTSTAIQLDNNGNILVVGAFEGTMDFDPGTGIVNKTSSGGTDAFVLKLDGNGNFMWIKSFGNNNNDNCSDFRLDATGYMYLTGGFNGTVNFDTGAGTSTLTSTPAASAGSSGTDIFISKLDPAGNLVWVKSMGGGDLDETTSIELDGSGNIYTTGTFYGTTDLDPGAGTANFTAPGWSNIFVSKLDASGNFVWAKSIGQTFENTGRGIAVNLIGEVYVTGYFNGTADFDPDAGTFNMSSAGLSDIFIMKLKNNGSLGWAKRIGDSGNDMSVSLATDMTNNVYVCGYYSVGADFDPGTGVFMLNSAGDEDTFILKLDANGNFLWANSIGGPGDDTFNASDLTIDASNNVYTTGKFRETVDFDPSPAVFNVTATGGTNLNSSDMFIHKLGYNQTSTGIKSIDGKNDIAKLYPNPNNGTFTIDLTEDVTMNIIDVLGNTLLNESKAEGHHSISLPNLANGVYFINLSNQKQQQTFKIIKSN